MVCDMRSGERRLASSVHAAWRLAVTLVLGCALSTVALAGDLSAAQRNALARRFGVKPANISAAPVSGLYQITSDTDVAYVTADGRFLFQGGLVDTVHQQNLTEQTQQQLRMDILKAVPATDMIRYVPANPRHSLIVFTDLDCGYCRRLHHAMPTLLQAGIEVRYLFYPRAGPGTGAWHKAEAVWCADDRRKALDEGFSGQALGQPGCDANAKIQHDYQLAQRIGATGTPAIVLDNGRLIPGLPPIPQLISLVTSGA